MRALSTAQASRCETAKHKTCRCRCGGALHGVNRADEQWKRDGLDEIKRDFFEQLPEDDPHHLPTQEEKKRRARERYALKKAKGQGFLFAIFADQEEA